MRALILAAVLFVAPAATAAAPCGGHGDRGSMVVTTTWLAAHQNDPNLVVLAVGDKSEYGKAHIPGSLYLDFHDISAQGGLTLELPPMPDLAETFGKLGVTDDSRIVLYTIGNASTQTARVYLTLDAMGLGARTSILDGGLAIWQGEARGVTIEVRAVKPGNFTPCPQTDVIASLDYVRANLQHAGIDIVDARDPQFYSGASASRNRAGHIAGAASIPYSSLLDEKGKLKSREVLQQQFRAAGVKTGDQIVAYCHIGQQASLLYFVSRYLGYDVRLFDGSWEEWARHPELPVELVQK
jgi:thiosulfate/3-mercaptopyruvate sulfurtransferase